MRFKRSTIVMAVLSATTMAMSVHAEDAEPETEEESSIMVITGFRSSLSNALAEKRESVNLVEIIEAIDIGKLPDQNLAEVLENIGGFSRMVDSPNGSLFSELLVAGPGNFDDGDGRDLYWY